jgi:hypothetical protein
MAKFLEQMDKTNNYQTALREAQKWGMDYSLADPSIKWARKHFIPFASFQYKIMPLLAETAIKRPWVIGMYMGIPYAISEIIKNRDDMTEEDWKELEKTVPEQLRERGTYFIVPWKINDKWQWFDYSYFLPWGNIMAAGSAVKNGQLNKLLADMGIASTPLLNIIKTFGSGILENEPPKDAYSGKPIYNKLDEPQEIAYKVSKYFYNQFAPSMLTEFGSLGYVFDIGEQDQWGRTVTPEQAFLRLAGINIQEANPQLANIVKKAKIEALKDELIKIMLDPKISDEKKERYKARFNEEIQIIMRD